MPNAHGTRARPTATLLVSCSLAILAFAFFAIASTARAAEAGGYGELSRFGQSSGFEGHLAPNYQRTRLIGVDPAEENAVFLLEEPKEPTPKKRFVRLAKYTANTAGEYSLSASSEFSIAAAEVVSTEPEIEGLAVDPAESKLYMLAVDPREAKLKHASRTTGGQGVLAASTLYAFSTGSLAPATGTKAGGVVIGEAELAANSEAAGAALLQPSGIAVDPGTHEVIVAGHEDDSTEQTDNPRSASDHYVLQRITASGTLGARYVDKGNVLKEEASVGERFPTPDSPTVVTVAGKERVYLGFNNGLAEIPYDFSSTSAPKVSPGPPAGIDGGISTLPGTTGGVVSSFEGTIFGASASDITNQEPGGEGRAGITAYSAETAAPIGWTGGAQLRGSEPRQKCVISPYNFSLLPNIAAGSEGKVFALAPEFILREEEGEPEIEEIEVENPKGSGEFEIEIIETPTFVPLPGPFFAPVVEFGPGGSGCPQATATAPVATVNGIEVKGEEAVKTGSEVIFSSQLKQADALKVEWNFGDGTSETVSGDEYQSTSVKHKFSKEGSFTVTEKIYSDDLGGVGTDGVQRGAADDADDHSHADAARRSAPAESAVHRPVNGLGRRSRRVREPLERSERRRRIAARIRLELRRRRLSDYRQPFSQLRRCRLLHSHAHSDRPPRPQSLRVGADHGQHTRRAAAARQWLRRGVDRHERRRWIDDWHHWHDRQSRRALLRREHRRRAHSRSASRAHSYSRSTAVDRAVALARSRCIRPAPSLPPGSTRRPW